MPYKRIRWFILWTPTLTIALWEYLRHTLLLPYMSMTLGNMLAPLIVFAVTVTLVRKLFGMLEQTSESLQRERLSRAALLEREQLARELHDGISQSLFLLSVKLDKLEHAQDGEGMRATAAQIRETVRHVYADVRQSIAALRSEPSMTDVQWMESVRHLAGEMERWGLSVELDWRLGDACLNAKEKVELLAIVREAMLNVQKHAGAGTLKVTAVPLGKADEGGFRCTIGDDGAGMGADRRTAKGCYGIRMMKGRADAMGWTFNIRSVPKAGEMAGGTVVEIAKAAGIAREKGGVWLDARS